LKRAHGELVGELKLEAVDGLVGLDKEVVDAVGGSSGARGGLGGDLCTLELSHL